MPTADPKSDPSDPPAGHGLRVLTAARAAGAPIGYGLASILDGFVYFTPFEVFERPGKGALAAKGAGDHALDKALVE